MTNTIYTIENVLKLSQRIVDVQSIEKESAEKLAEFMLKYAKTNDFKSIYKTIN